MVTGGAYCLPKLWNQINPGPNSVFILKLRGAVQEARALLLQYSAEADSSSASRVFILSCADSDRKGFSTRVEKKRVGRGGNSKEVSGYWMISTVCCTPLAAGLPRHSWTHLLCMCMDPFGSQIPRPLQEAGTKNPCIEKKKVYCVSLGVKETTKVMFKKLQILLTRDIKFIGFVVFFCFFFWVILMYWSLSSGLTGRHVTVQNQNHQNLAGT